MKYNLFISRASVCSLLLIGIFAVALSSCEKPIQEIIVQDTDSPDFSGDFWASRIVTGISGDNEEPADTDEGYCDEWFSFVRNDGAFFPKVVCAPWFSYDTVYAKGQISFYDRTRAASFPIVAGSFNGLKLIWPASLDMASAEPLGLLDISAEELEFYGTDANEDGLWDTEIQSGSTILTATNVPVSLSNSADLGRKVYQTSFSRIKDGYKELYIVYWQQNAW